MGERLLGWMKKTYLLKVVNYVFIHYNSETCGEILGWWRSALNTVVCLVAKAGQRCMRLDLGQPGCLAWVDLMVWLN